MSYSLSSGTGGAEEGELWLEAEDLLHGRRCF